MRKITYILLSALIMANSAVAEDLFFSDKKLMKDLYDVVEGNRKITPPGPSRAELEAQIRREMESNQNKTAAQIRAEIEARLAKEKAEAKRAEEERKAEEERIAKELKPLKLGNWHLKSIMMIDAQNWTMWVGDKKYTPDTMPEFWHVIYIKNDSAVLVYNNKNLKHFDFFVKDNLKEIDNLKYWQYASEDKKIVANLDDGIIRVSLDIKEQFIGHELRIVEKDEVSEDEKEIVHPKFQEPVKEVKTYTRGVGETKPANNNPAANNTRRYNPNVGRINVNSFKKRKVPGVKRY